MSRGRVVLDLVAPQSPSYRDRGIARHGLAFAEALVEGHGDLVEQVLVHPELPPAAGMERLMASGKVGSVLASSPEGGIFHVTSPFEPEIAARALWPRRASARRMRLAVTVYDLIPDIFPDLYLQDPGLRRRWRCGRELVRAADHVFTLSESGREDVVRMLGVREAAVTVIGSGCDDRFRPASDPGRSASAARAAVAGLGEHFVVCNGAIDPRKNLPRLVESFSLLPPASRDGLQLVIVCRATEPERHHFMVMAEQLGIAGRLLLPGFVPDEALVALYQSARLAVFPSLYEGYGLPVIEARACGALVLAGDNSSLREITPAMARFDASDAQAMAALIDRAVNDPAFRSALRAATDGPPPTWAGVADRAAEGYRRVLGHDAKTRPLVPGWRSRPSVALVCGRADHPDSAVLHDRRLVQALAAASSLDVYTTAVGGLPGVPGELPLAAHDRLDRWRGGYDATVVRIGDDPRAVPASLIERLSDVGTVVVVARNGGSAPAHAAPPGDAPTPGASALALPWSCPPPAGVAHAHSGPAVVAVLEPHHAAGTVGAMAAALRRSHPEARVVVIGGQAAADPAASTGIDEAVIDSGWDGGEVTLAELLGSVSVAVAWPADPAAPLPWSVAVALAAGVPVLAAGPAPDALGDAAGAIPASRSGLAGAVDVAAAAAALLDDRDRRHRLGRAGQAFAATHTFRAAAATILAAVDDASRPGGVRAPG